MSERREFALDIPDILPPSEDGIFRTLLSHPDAHIVLCDLLSSVLGKPVIDAKIRNAELPITAIDEKRERFDVNCVLDGGRQVDVEMQTTPMIGDSSLNSHEILRKRLIYNLCDLHAKQAGRGSDYNELMQSFQVTFANYSVLPDEDKFMRRFSFRDDGGYELDDAVGIILIELSKLGKLLKRPVDEMTGAEQWALFFANANKPDFKPMLEKITASREAIRMATSILASISKDDDERARFRSRRIYQMDKTTELNAARREGLVEGVAKGLAEGVAKGLAEGLAEGVAKGLAEGRKDSAYEIARKLVAAGVPFEIIIGTTGLAAEQIDRIRDSK